MTRIDGEPAKYTSAAYKREERERERRTRRRLDEINRADHGGSGLTEADDAEQQRRDDELAELVDAGAEHAKRRAATDPRLAEKLRQQRLAQSFAEAVDVGPRTGVQLMRELGLTDDDSSTDTKRN